MDEMSFGEVLRQTRERKGFDLNTTARRLRIRPDILLAIEAGNFAAMPPRGYTRNMITGYARYLGLNPTEITGMYLAELADYESGISASRRRGTGFDMSEAPANDRFPLRGATGRIGTADSRRSQRQQNSGRSGSRRAGERQDGGINTRAGSQLNRGYADNSYGYGSSRENQTRGGVLPSSSYIAARPKSGFGSVSPLRSKLPFIIAAVAILVVVILVCVFLFGGKSNKDTSAVSTMPVTGLSDASNSGSDETSSSSAAPVAPTSATFEFKVAQGQSTYIEVYVDGENKITEDVTGPSTESFTFSDTLKFVCANKNAVTATMDGEPLTLEEGSSGIVNTTYKFSDILKEWQSKNGVTTSSKASSVSTSSSKSATASTSSSSRG